MPAMAASAAQAAVRVRTFRAPALERLQHATAAALVAQRYGVAGLRWGRADETAPPARRYFAFLAAGVFRSIEEAQEHVCPTCTTFTPQPETRETYDKLYGLFRRIYFDFGKPADVINQALHEYLSGKRA